ncbi:helix-turn-helix domain-containing protein [Caulobacter mirabilis]|uniref:Transcriptional regulator n=1 Tax=Caulobacter mirabilis TaxID=69666 RepID=A0A2D2AVB4_9CAUL|nr:helix-turn-helix transcriptional regulator [Caulobacter mirabilis]ATQ41949.1 transcriptional regulator [Caulobacter mirabilis]
MSTQTPIGELIRDWRQRRRLTQMDLAYDAEISPKHLSFIETGRSKPSRQMVLHLAEQMDVPLREQNAMLVAAGFAPVFPERGLDAPDLAAARRAIDLILKGHEPFPALAVDRHWNLVTANAAITPFLLADVELLTPPVNVLRLTLHPKGLAPRITNLTEWRGHLLDRLRRQIDATADAGLQALYDELKAYPAPPAAVGAPHGQDLGGVAVPMRLQTDHGTMAFISTVTVFGTPTDVTLSELAMETFFPADDFTAKALISLAADRQKEAEKAA